MHTASCLPLPDLTGAGI